MRTEDPRPIRLKDYTPPAFTVSEVKLDIELDPRATRVHSTLRMARNPAHPDATAPITLDGEKMALHEVRLNGEVLGANRYSVSETGLTIHDAPDGLFTLETVTTCAPEENTALEGLYLTGDIYCTQCEAEGFRRITYYPDRPDVMAVFRTRITGDRGKLPILLSIGTPVHKGKTKDGRHFVE